MEAANVTKGVSVGSNTLEPTPTAFTRGLSMYRYLMGNPRNHQHSNVETPY
jgi:hypothetical protein